MKTSLITLCLVVLFSMTISTQLFADAHAKSSITPDEVLKQLIKGNDDFVNEKTSHADISKKRRTDTTAGQSPYAIIVTCSDSRVPAEHVFSAGLGDIFVIRTAGNVIGDIELASIAYGVEHLGSKVVMIMGHTSCGAVGGASAGNDEESLIPIMSIIKPVIANTKDIKEAEKLNVRNSYDAILKSSIVKEKLEKKEIEVVPAVYDISTGKVEILK